MRQIATLMGATCCTRLATLLQLVATCCELKIELVSMPRRNIVARTWPNDYNIMQQLQMLHEKFDQFQISVNDTKHVVTRRNRVAKRTQHVASNNVAICCVENVAIVWPGLRSLKSLFSFSQPDRFAQRRMAVIRLAKMNRLFLSENKCHTLCTITTICWMKYIISKTNISKNIE